MRGTFTPRNRAAWRRWLTENHARRDEVWLVFFKQGSGKPSLRYADAVEEALCFGWIDGLKKRLDQERYTHRFSPRTAKSKWSSLNKKRAEKLLRAGLMAPAGQAAIAAAKRSGEWHRAAAPVRGDTLPPELEAALGHNDDDISRFAQIPPSHRRAYLAYVAEAKHVATRERRAKRVVELVRSGGKPIDI